MAARLTDKQKKKIVADYIESQSINAAAKKNGVSWGTTRRVIEECGEIEQKLEQKKEENTADILAYMERQRDRVCGIIDVGLSALPERLENAKSASEITTALGTLIDKWAAISGGVSDTREDDALSKSLKELAGGLESDTAE